MASFQNGSCNKASRVGDNYNASVQITPAQGETIGNVWVVIFPTGSPGTTSQSLLNLQGGAYVTTAATAPPNTSGPYSYYFLVEILTTQQSSTGEVGPPP